MEKGDRCLSCGRSLIEVSRTRELIDQLGDLALQMDYDNLDEFAAYIGSKLIKKVRYRRENPQ